MFGKRGRRVGGGNRVNKRIRVGKRVFKVNERRGEAAPQPAECHADDPRSLNQRRMFVILRAKLIPRSYL